MTIHRETSLRLISRIGRDLISMADEAEGMDNWLQRHSHVRLFAEEIYGDSEEATMLSCSLSLHKDKSTSN